MESDTCTCTKKLRPGEECDPNNPDEKCPEGFQCMCNIDTPGDICTCTKTPECIKNGNTCSINNDKCCKGKCIKTSDDKSYIGECSLLDEEKPECIKNGNTCSIINDKCCKGKCIKTSDDLTYIGECSLLDEEKRGGEKLTPKQNPCFPRCG